MYPMLKEDVSMGTFDYEGSDDTQYYVENGEGEVFIISYELFRALLHADGTRPLLLRNCSKNKLRKLKRNGIIQTSRFVPGGGVFNRFIIVLIDSRGNNDRPLYRKMNRLLPVVSILLFISGVLLRLVAGELSCYAFNEIQYYAFVILSLTAHEMGHFIAGVSAKYKFTDAGILLLGVIPIGAYVAHKENKEATKNEKLQLALAGIEMNLLVAGLFLVAAVIVPTMYYTFICAANVNVVLAVLNLMPAEGLDGELALSAICGVDHISETAKKWLFNKKRRKKLLHNGIRGYGGFCLLGFTLISKVLVWALIVGDMVLLLIEIL